MTYQELVQAIKQLPIEQRLSLLTVLTSTLQAEQPSTPITSSLTHIRGLLKPDGPLPTEADLTATYTDYLLEKYS